MKNKKIIAIIIILVAIVIALVAFFGIREIKKSKYTKADEYEVKGLKFASVKSVVGEKKIKKYSYKKNNIETLELTFVDSDKENTANKYIETLKDGGNFIDMRLEDSNKRQIARKENELTTVQTEITDDGFILTIEVGPGEITDIEVGE